MAKPRSNVEIKSTVPDFKATPSEDYRDWLLVTCTRADCPSHRRKGTDPMPFLVHRTTWKKKFVSKASGLTLTTRPCPYCFRVSRIPGTKKD